MSVNTSLYNICDKIRDKWESTGNQFIFGTPQVVDNIHSSNALRNGKLIMIMYPPSLTAPLKELKRTDNAWNEMASFTFMVYDYLPSEYNVIETDASLGKAPLARWSNMIPIILKWFNKVSNPTSLSYEMESAILMSDLK